MEHDIDWMVARYKAGHSTEDIGQAVGKSSGAVWYALKKAGVDFRAKTERKYPDRSCEDCGASYVPKGQASKFCPACAEARIVKRKEGGRKRKEERPCPSCGQLFYAFLSKLACSPLCERVMEGKKWCYYHQDSHFLEAFGKDKSRPDGLDVICREGRRRADAVWREKNPEKSRQYAREAGRRRKWQEVGITEKDYWEYYEELGGKCEICGKHEDYLAVDHDHITGEFRGLLCTHCNVALGFLGDDVARILEAAAYLERKETQKEAA